MRLIDFEQGDAIDSLPLDYDPDAIAAYWSKRPAAVTQRVFQLLGVSGWFITSIVGDILFKRVKQNEVLRAQQLRDIVTSLGPAYIKLGHALYPAGHPVAGGHERAAEVVRQGSRL